MAVRLFISHASEDKADFVEPLAHALRDAGYEVWYDRFSLTLGDSLLAKINQGLREADYGVFVLSPSFFQKKWPRAELDGLFALETAERKVILPIWKDVTEADVKAFSPILAGQLGISASEGVPKIVEEIGRAVSVATKVASFSAIENVTSQFYQLDAAISGDKRAKDLASTPGGVRLASDAVASLLRLIKAQIENISKSSELLKFRIDSSSQGALTIYCPYSIIAVISYRNFVINSVSSAELRFFAYQNLDPWGTDFSKRRDLCQKSFRPAFNRQGTLVWKCKESDQSFITEQLGAHVLESIVKAIADLHAESVSRDER